ncbi:hypothetical protein AOLI_G00201350 [Acnodon oligacanthus]
MRLTWSLTLLLCSGMMSGAIEPISTGLAMGIAAAVTGFLARYQNVLYYFQECCRPEWISYNKTGRCSSRCGLLGSSCGSGVARLSLLLQHVFLSLEKALAELPDRKEPLRPP